MKVIVIGGTAAGTSAAAKAKRLMPDDDIKIIEKGNILSFGACGLPYFIGDFFSDPNEMIARTKEAFEKSGVKIDINHEVIGLDVSKKEITIKADGKEKKETYDKLMIATGARGVVLPFMKGDFSNLYQCKTMDDGLSLKKALLDSDVKKVTIIGGGFVGVELVEACHQLGKEVTLVELDQHIMGTSFGEEACELFEKECQKHGITLRLNERVEAFEGTPKITKVKTNKGEIETDLVIVSAGVKPNTEFVGDALEKLENGAILVNDKGETSVPDIYSAGDCASVKHNVSGDNVYIPLATYANKLGRIVGENLAGKNKHFQGAIGSVGIKVMDLEAGKTGLTEKELQLLDIPYKKISINDKNQTSYYPGQVPRSSKWRCVN